MKQIHINLKRFDILEEYGGVNREAQDVRNWAGHLFEGLGEGIRELKKQFNVNFVFYLPEAHLIPALQAFENQENLSIGCQGLHWEDTSHGGNFGAFTSLRTANSMRQLGVKNVIIGHTEERNHLKAIMKTVDSKDHLKAENELLNKSAQQAIASEMNILYCIGESSQERESGAWQELLKQQLALGLAVIPLDRVIIGYEPIWAIGPGKTPPNKEQIQEVLTYIKSLNPDYRVIYGGGLKEDNAEMLASIGDLDGGLIALTRFSGEIGFYPDEFFEIAKKFLKRSEA